MDTNVFIYARKVEGRDFMGDFAYIDATIVTVFSDNTAKVNTFSLGLDSHGETERSRDRYINTSCNTARSYAKEAISKGCKLITSDAFTSLVASL